MTVTTAGLLIALVAPMAPAVATPASAAPALAAPVTQAPSVSGKGPDDLLYYSVTGLTPGDLTTISIDGVGSNDYHRDLGSRPATSGSIRNLSGERTPADIPPGTYTITFDQTAADPTDGQTVTTPPFTIAPPTAQTPTAFPALLPGADASVSLLGFGAGPTVHRSLAIDGTPVPSTSLEPTTGFGVYSHFAIPTTLTAGTHTLAVTQDVAPSATATVGFTVVGPRLTSSVTSTSSRGTVTVSGDDFGIDDVVTVAVTDAAQRRVELATVTGSRTVSATVDLPGLAAGTATLSATSRHNGAVASVQVTVVPSQLTSPQLLPSLGQLQSPNGHATLRMQDDGNLVLTILGQARWSSRTNGHPGVYLAVQGDGNLVIRTPAGVVLWTARTAGQEPPVRLVVQDDGNVVLYGSSGRAVWSTGTAGDPAGTLLAGQSLLPGGRVAGPGKVALVMQSDGNAVLLGRSGTPVWSTRTAGNPGARLTLQSDGNLVVRATNGLAVFANRAVVGGGARLIVQGDGNLVERDGNGRAVWTSDTAGR